jgi:hypothetical protein
MKEDILDCTNYRGICLLNKVIRPRIIRQFVTLRQRGRSAFPENPDYKKMFLRTAQKNTVGASFKSKKIHHLQDLDPPGPAVWQWDMGVDQLLVFEMAGLLSIKTKKYCSRWAKYRLLQSIWIVASKILWIGCNKSLNRLSQTFETLPIIFDRLEHRSIFCVLQAISFFGVGIEICDFSVGDHGFKAMETVIENLIWEIQDPWNTVFY